MPDDIRYRVEIRRSSRFWWTWDVHRERVYPDGRVRPDPGRPEAVPHALTYKRARRQALRRIARISAIEASEIRFALIDGNSDA